MKLKIISIMLLSSLTLSAYAITNQDISMTNTSATENAVSTDKGQTFLTANKKKKGVVTLPSGLQYKVITAGKGAKPTLTDNVTVHYVGKLVNGTEFDSSYSHGQPITFPVNGVIAGWTEALLLMKTGSTWELYIPANLAYGENGMPPVIGPNETLIFKVNLIDVKKG